MMSSLGEITGKVIRHFFTKFGREKRRLRKMPRFLPGTITIADKQFLFHDSGSFLHTYHEIFETGIYQFTPNPKKKLILDCGANMGLSVLYFSSHYPDHHIIAFEPDDTVYGVLETNVKTYRLSNVTLVKKAVWDKEETLDFFTDRGMGGRALNAYQHQSPKRVQALRLKDYISDDVGFLKIDIEGAEAKVIFDCRDKISKVDKLFLEYHSIEGERQTLHELLEILQQNDFHYYVKESVTRRRPFLDRELICESFDMAINIFGYHPTVPSSQIGQESSEAMRQDNGRAPRSASHQRRDDFSPKFPFWR